MEVPTEFERLMKKHGVLAVFEKLSYTNRKEYCRWISEAKREETRRMRLAKSIEMLENGVLPKLARERQLSCYKHDGFWQPMDTLRDKRLLEGLWASGNPPWVRP